MNCRTRLLELGSPPICNDRPDIDGLPDSDRFRELVDFCEKRNGVYLFESALHVFPLCNHSDHIGFHAWNALETWKREYDGVVDHIAFFAEDIFGEQFGIASNAIVSFNPESGQVMEMCRTLEDWACDVLAGYELLTGYPFAHEWQQQFGPIGKGMRLAPKTPFIFGGEYALSNLYAADALKLMRFRADIFRQIRDLPDGARVKMTVRW